MFSSIHEYLRRLDVRLTVYYTVLLLVLTGIVLVFIAYRKEPTLLKQVDRMLQEELLELTNVGEHDGADFAHACESYAREVGAADVLSGLFQGADPGGCRLFSELRQLADCTPLTCPTPAGIFTPSLCMKSPLTSVFTCAIIP